MLKLTPEQIQEKIDFIEDYKKAKNAAEGSKVDANANVSIKNIATMEAEINKDINIQINRAMLCNKIEELYWKELSNEYIRQVESHELYIGDESALRPYCTSITMYPFLLDGLTKLGWESKAPTHINSFCWSFVNLIFAVSAQFAGAVATVEFLMYLDYFARKDYGDDYLNTHKKEMENHLQHVVYAINQPASARGYQSVFWNISIYDKYYFDSMFGNFVFPDGTSAKWQTVKGLQMFFMDWFNKERSKALLTFPVVTAAMLSHNDEPKDEEFADFLSHELAKWNSFFIYMSDNADSLSSCCFKGLEKITVIDDKNKEQVYTLKEFTELFLQEDGEKKISWYKMLSFDKEGNSKITNITGVLRKENTQRKLLEIEVYWNKIQVTMDHPLMVKVKESGEIKEILAHELIWKESSYLLPTI